MTPSQRTKLDPGNMHLSCRKKHKNETCGSFPFIKADNRGFGAKMIQKDSKCTVDQEGQKY